MLFFLASKAPEDRVLSHLCSPIKWGCPEVVLRGHIAGPRQTPFLASVWSDGYCWTQLRALVSFIHETRVLLSKITGACWNEKKKGGGNIFLSILCIYDLSVITAPSECFMAPTAALCGLGSFSKDNVFLYKMTYSQQLGMKMFSAAFHEKLVAFKHYVSLNEETIYACGLLCMCNYFHLKIS